MSTHMMSSVCTVLWRKKTCIIPTVVILVVLLYLLQDGSSVTSFSDAVKAKLPSDIQGAIDNKFRVFFKQGKDKNEDGDEGQVNVNDGHVEDVGVHAGDHEGHANEGDGHAHGGEEHANEGDGHVDEHHHDDVNPEDKDYPKQSSKLEDFDILPMADKIKTWSDDQLAFMFYRYTTRLQYKCMNLARMSVAVNDTWVICKDEPFQPGQRCLVYSFGLTNVTPVEKYLASTMQCEVHYFQPNVEQNQPEYVFGVQVHAFGLASQNGRTEHGWRVRTLNTIIQEMGHQNKTIDILKIDLDKWEWQALPEVVQSGALNHVTQLLLAMHATTEPSPENYRERLIMFEIMYSMNFRIANIFERKETFSTRLHEMMSTEIEILFLRIPVYS
ncbi:uncharacterized protein LOC121376262 [Gigantopelta aegis]|uniref:uncharacterized protein LOC121376262 n=1 Tax=Gigantopelta aegis TaxID=1735272 RepID=UPI001B88CD07|nr:uncharacterized protein LOC121376262 [Gigantopelta aegis]